MSKNTQSEDRIVPSSQYFKYKKRPFKPGYSVSHLDFDPGSACAMVTRRFGRFAGQALLLSCEHVLFQDGGVSSTRLVHQPAKRDQNSLSESTVIGVRLAKSGLNFSGSNDVDAAVARLVLPTESIMSNYLPDGTGKISGISNEIRAGDQVIFYGRVSGKSYGRVVNPNDTKVFAFNLAQLGTRYLQFTNIVKCDYSSEDGDSGGAVILERNRKLLGMHFAGGDGFAYFCRASVIFRKLNLRLY